MRAVCENCIHYGDNAPYPYSGWCTRAEEYVQWDDTCICWDDQEWEEEE